MIPNNVKAVFLFLLLLNILSSCAHRRSERAAVHPQNSEQPLERVQSPQQPSSTDKVDQLSIKQVENLETPKDGIFPSQVLRRIPYTISYNNKTKNPNWVAWHLTSDHLDGPYNRKGVPYYDDKGNAIGIMSFTNDVVYGDYFVDREVPAPRQEHSDWKEHPSNIDHGHMCPAADCKWSKEAINQSFLLTNMCPQDHELNGGDWENLEDKCRKWTKKYGDIYIVAGPIFYDGVKNTFGANRIAIPDAFFKVVLCTKGTPKALGFIYSNNAEKQPMNQTVCSVDEVERVTNIDFFSSLPDEVEETVESSFNLRNW